MGSNFEDFVKYPRTPHVFGSKGTDDDKRLGLKSSLEMIRSNNLVIEEKVDGSNSAVQFSPEGNIILQNRGQYWFEMESDKPWEKGLTHPQYDLFKNWTLARKQQLFSVLGTRFILYGEWMYARHHIHYDSLPHYFLEFDIYDKMEKYFLDTSSRKKILKGSGVISVAMLHQGPVKSLEKLQTMIVKSCYASVKAEGLYLKIESAGIVHERAKFVRKDFTQEIIDLGRHWSDVKMVPNRLKADADIFEFTPVSKKGTGKK
jgi:hypothetical protein